MERTGGAEFDLAEARRIICRGLAGLRARVYLFGSWARGDARRTSDIDVAIDPNDRAAATLYAATFRGIFKSKDSGA